MKDNLTGLFILIGFIVILLAKFIAKFFFKGNPITTRFLARTAVFAAISIILYTVPGLKFSLPIFPKFLEIHLDEIPAFIAGFAYGPLSGFLVIFVKTIVKLPITSSACVGELADFIYSVAFVVPAAWIYKKHRTLKGAGVAMLAAMIIQMTFSSFVTTFVMLDAYSVLYHLPKPVILSMCKAINPAVDDLQFKFLLMVALPFNALKDGIVVVATFILYKRLRLLFKRIDAQKN